MERVIVWGDRATERAERTTTRQRVIVGIAAVLAAARLRDGGDPLGHPADAGSLTSLEGV